MKVKYWWKESESLRDGIMRPKCDCAEVLDDFKGLVFSFLNDDEGLGLKYLTPVAVLAIIPYIILSLLDNRFVETIVAVVIGILIAYYLLGKLGLI